jgi:hypothetical protein
VLKGRKRRRRGGGGKSRGERRGRRRGEGEGRRRKRRSVFSCTVRETSFDGEALLEPKGKGVLDRDETDGGKVVSEGNGFEMRNDFGRETTFLEGREQTNVMEIPTVFPTSQPGGLFSCIQFLHLSSSPGVSQCIANHFFGGC